MTGVQIIGKDALLNRFQKFDTETWGLFQGKQFIVGGTGEETLTDWLDDLSKAGSTATYILRVYDNDQVPTSATANSNYLASLNFKLIDMYEGYGIAGHTTKLMQRIEGIEKRLDDESEPDEKEEGLNDVIMGWLNNPEKLGLVIGAVKQLMGGPAVQPAIASTQPAQAIAGFSVQDSNPDTSGDRLERLAAALDKLDKIDTRLVEHMEKLAKLATDDPALFNAVISKLDAL